MTIPKQAVRAAARVIADAPTIDAPKLPPECWEGTARAILEAALPLMGVQRPEDVDLEAAGDLAGRLTAAAGRYGVGFDIPALFFEAARMIERLAHPHTGQPQEGWQPIHARPLADDPMWFYRNVGAGHEIDGPRGARADDADWWQMWAPCEPPLPRGLSK